MQTAPPDHGTIDQHVAVAEKRLVSRIRNRRGIARSGIGVVTGAAIVTGLVATNVLGLAGWRGGADPAAAAVLHQAALDTLETSDLAVGEGQYLHIRTTAVYSSTSNDASWLTVGSDDLYVPADRSDEWVWVRPAQEIYQTFGAASERAAVETQRAQEQEWGVDVVERLRAPGGAFYGADSAVGDESLASLPRDPYLLLNHIYRTTIGQGLSPDAEALIWIADRLRSGVVPADLRAAMYRAAAMIPGVEIADEKATLDGQTGVAIGIIAGGVRQDIIIDTSNGRLIGERQVLLAAENGMPAGTPIAWTSVETDVADSAPAGGSPNGFFDVRGCTMTAPGAFECTRETSK